MKLKLTPRESRLILTRVKSVLATGKDYEWPRLHLPAGAIIKALETIPGLQKEIDEDDEIGNGEGFSTNGWQWDWWQTFTYKGKRYTLSGSGYHGGHTFHLSDNQ